jgi:hypothetical protein
MNEFMSRLKNVGLTAFGLSAVLCFSMTGQAQWLPDRAYTEGPGIRLGDLELHPGVAVRGGYDNNVFRSESRRVGSAILAVTPHVNIKTLGKQRLTQGEDSAGANPQDVVLPPVAFNLGASGTFFKYFEDTAPTNAEVDADGILSILPERAFGVDIGAAYTRAVRPFGQASGFTANNLFAIDTIKPVANLRAQSRSGVLRGALGYTPQIQIFENALYDFLSSTTQQVSASAGWKFLPSTALVYDGSFGYQQYKNSDNANVTLLLSRNAYRFQSRLGINGVFTNHISARVLVGYAVATFSERQLREFETVIGEAAINYRIDTSVFELGYTRSLDPSPLGAWMEQDRGHVSIETLFARVFAVKLSGGVAGANYGRLLNAQGGFLGFDKTTNQATDKRTDLRGDAGVHLEYRATNWLAIMGDFALLATKTDFSFGTVGVTPFAAQFLSLQAFGGVRVHY